MITTVYGSMVKTNKRKKVKSVTDLIKSKYYLDHPICFLLNIPTILKRNTGVGLE